MSMSKKDYQAFARVFHQTRTFGGRKFGLVGALTSEQQDVWETLRDDLMSFLKVDNSRFDRERFIEATETGKCRGMKQ